MGLLGVELSSRQGKADQMLDDWGERMIFLKIASGNGVSFLVLGQSL
jgi:hypothetical protein